MTRTSVRAEGPRRRLRPPAWTGPAAFAVVVLLTISANGISARTSPGLPQSPAPGFNASIHHILFLVQENHAYDSLYGEYCLVAGPYCPSAADGIPNGTCVPLSPNATAGACVTPFNFSARQMTPKDLAHNWPSTHTAYANGSMDGFYQAEGRTLETFGHYNASTATVYWDLAEEYGLADQFFSPAASYSLPNHWYTVAASAPSISYRTKLDSHTLSASTRFQYLNESNATPALEDELHRSGVSWRYYDFRLQGYNYSTNPIPDAPAYAYWNPLAAKNLSYHAGYRPNFVPRSDFFSDAASGNLPDIGWIIPSAQDSDHPPFNLSNGQDWVASVVNALEASPEWNSTVLFVTWDEYGGFYDHVAPPQISSTGYGFRVPLLAIGPWVRQGYVDNDTMSFNSVLRLMELRFKLGCLGSFDCNATLPLAFFNFSGSPRAPIPIPMFGNATYPMPLQSSGALAPFRPSPPTDPAQYDIEWTGPAPQILDWG